ncbi:putative splicing factor 3B subunit 2 [Cocos nucifera]|uniref:Putative splicing factor 3B subunit 2 n=1 Tax=Cocos nucifera TaxID=13894 RepID=A0A8K0N6M8_COCNU|nr:putative splicing factor 3B subunit 2 [Cocos nucifera]
MEIPYPNSGPKAEPPSNGGSAVEAEKKKARESERRRRRRKQKKNNKASSLSAGAGGDESKGGGGGAQNEAKENTDPNPEDDFIKDEAAANAASKKEGDADSEEEEQDTQQKEKGLSNKKKKLQRRMKIAELKQRCSRPDVVEAYIEKEDSKKLKQKQGERMQPKIGKMDIDYQVKLREMKPRVLSQELKEALGMPEGASPPWLINMQRHGPPPSYLHLKIPGLNSPIPPGASFGYHPRGWAKPPVDDTGRPLYGDVFGLQQQEQINYEEEPVDQSKHWDDLEEEEEEEEEEMEEEDTSTGVETPDVIDLRKQQRNNHCRQRRKRK